MKKVLHKSVDRGYADHGWLRSNHSFSFANYYNPARLGFGALLVLNDDVVQGGHGFPAHPHQDMEIISIPLAGALEHKDSMGNTHVIKDNEVQVMSAGTGVVHSEFDHSPVDEVNFLQIWIVPRENGLEPRYDQKVFERSMRANKWQTLVCPRSSDAGLWINQNAYISRTELSSGKELAYTLHDATNGVYTMVLTGQIEIAGEVLNTKDALGVWNTEGFDIKALKDADVLLIEVPINNIEKQ